MYIKQSDRAFTLVELLVVIAIIALLLSILMPALGRVREGGRRVVCGSNEKSIVTGFILYASEYLDYIVPDRSIRVNPKTRAVTYSPTDIQVGRPWDSSLSQQWTTKGTDTFKKLVSCPVDRTERDTPPRSAWFTGGKFLKRSYAPNGAMYNDLWAPWTPSDLRGNSTGIPTKSAQVWNPSRVVLLTEFFKGPNWNNNGVPFGNVQGTNYYDAMVVSGGPEVYWAKRSGVTNKKFNTVHDEGGNFAFVDGHVQWCGAIKGQDYITGTPFKNISWPLSWRWRK